MENFDVIIVGGGPMGLASAYECSVKESKRVLLLERFQDFANIHGSSPGYSRQFRVSYSEYYLSDMALQTYDMWQVLKKELNDDSILQETGCLWFGDPTVSSGEGNIDQAIDNLIELGQIENEDYTVHDGKEEIMDEPKFKFVSGAVANIDDPKALFTVKGGTVGVPALVEGYVHAMRKIANVTLINNARVIKIDHTNVECVEVKARVGTTEITYYGDKVIMTPGTYVNEVLATLHPSFNYQINLTIYLWSSTYFTRKYDTPSCTDPALWPIWYFFGPKPQEDGGSDDPNDFNEYYGFPSEPDRPQYLRVAPAFTSEEEFDFVVHPPPINERPVDEHALKFTGDFVREYMPDLDPSRNADEETTCVAGFAEVVEGSNSDEGAGFVLDFLPDTNCRIVVFTGGWAMKFVPMIGKILTDLAIRGHTQYHELIQPWNINRGVLKEISPTLSQKLKPAKRSFAQKAAAFRKIWC